MELVNESEDRYYVIKFIDKPFETIDKYVCIPQCWLLLSEPNVGKEVLVAYPPDNLSQIKERIQKKEKVASLWTIYSAILKYDTDRFDDADSWIAMMNDDALYRKKSSAKENKCDQYMPWILKPIETNERDCKRIAPSNFVEPQTSSALVKKPRKSNPEDPKLLAKTDKFEVVPVPNNLRWSLKDSTEKQSAIHADHLNHKQRTQETVDKRCTEVSGVAILEEQKSFSENNKNKFQIDLNNRSSLPESLKDPLRKQLDPRLLVRNDKPANVISKNSSASFTSSTKTKLNKTLATHEIDLIHQDNTINKEQTKEFVGKRCTQEKSDDQKTSFRQCTVRKITGRNVNFKESNCNIPSDVQHTTDLVYQDSQLSIHSCFNNSLDTEEIKVDHKQQYPHVQERRNTENPERLINDGPNLQGILKKTRESVESTKSNHIPSSKKSSTLNERIQQGLPHTKKKTMKNPENHYIQIFVDSQKKQLPQVRNTGNAQKGPHTEKILSKTSKAVSIADSTKSTTPPARKNMSNKSLQQGPHAQKTISMRKNSGENSKDCLSARTNEQTCLNLENLIYQLSAGLSPREQQLIKDSVYTQHLQQDPFIPTVLDNISVGHHTQEICYPKVKSTTSPTVRNISSSKNQACSQKKRLPQVSKTVHNKFNNTAKQIKQLRTSRKVSIQRKPPLGKGNGKHKLPFTVLGNINKYLEGNPVSPMHPSFQNQPLQKTFARINPGTHFMEMPPLTNAPASSTSQNCSIIENQLSNLKQLLPFCNIDVLQQHYPYTQGETYQGTFSQSYVPYSAQNLSVMSNNFTESSLTNQSPQEVRAPQNPQIKIIPEARNPF